MTTNKFLRPIFIMCTFLTLITITSCEKEDQEPFADCIDDPTCEYFRCKVDGEWWTPYCEQGPLFGCSATDVQYYRDLNGGGLSILADNDKNKSGFNITSNNVQNINIKYKLHRKDKDLTEYFEDIDQDGNLEGYVVDTNSVNYIEFSKIDTIKFILEGEIFFTGINAETNKKYIFENFKFRLPYRF